MKRFILRILANLGIVLVLVSCQKTPMLEFSGPTSLSFTSDGGSKSISFTTNRAWFVSSSEPWCKVSPSSGSAAEGNTTVIITVEKNHGYDSRTCTITLNVEELSKTVEISQLHSEEIIVDNKEVNVSWKPETVVVHLQTNTDFDVIIPDPSWCTAELLSTKGLEGAQVNLSIKANVTFTPRTQTILFKQKQGSIERQVMVSQSAREELVDMGLSVKWRTYNLGATNVIERGDYYAWGETDIKDQYLESNYKWYRDGDIKQVIKYNMANNPYFGQPEPDGKYVLEPEDDVASIKMGKNWRMPTYFEAMELTQNSSCEYVEDYFETGVSGMVITSTIQGYEEASLFFPLTGWRSETLKYDDKQSFTWLSTQSCYAEAGSSSLACVLIGDKSRSFFVATVWDRDLGATIRPVYDDKKHTQGIQIKQ